MRSRHGVHEKNGDRAAAVSRPAGRPPGVPGGDGNPIDLQLRRRLDPVLEDVAGRRGQAGVETHLRVAAVKIHAQRLIDRHFRTPRPRRHAPLVRADGEAAGEERAKPRRSDNAGLSQFGLRRFAGSRRRWDRPLRRRRRLVEPKPGHSPTGQEIGHGHGVRRTGRPPPRAPRRDRRTRPATASSAERPTRRVAAAASCPRWRPPPAGTSHRPSRPSAIGRAQRNSTICACPACGRTWTAGSGPGNGSNCSDGSVASCTRRICPAAAFSFSRASMITEPGRIFSQNNSSASIVGAAPVAPLASGQRTVSRSAGPSSATSRGGCFSRRTAPNADAASTAGESPGSANSSRAVAKRGIAMSNPSAAALPAPRAARPGPGDTVRARECPRRRRRRPSPTPAARGGRPGARRRAGVSPRRGGRESAPAPPGRTRSTRTGRRVPRGPVVRTSGPWTTTPDRPPRSAASLAASPPPRTPGDTTGRRTAPARSIFRRSGVGARRRG